MRSSEIHVFDDSIAYADGANVEVQDPVRSNFVSRFKNTSGSVIGPGPFNHLDGWSLISSTYKNEFASGFTNTGLIYGGEITKGVGNNEINISAGAGLIVDRSDRLNPNVYHVTWADANYTLNWDGGTAWALFIFINSNGVIHAYTETQSVGYTRDNIYLGSVSRDYTTGETRIGSILSAPVTAEDMSSTMIDYFKSTFLHKVHKGLVLKPIPGEMKTSLTSGTVVGLNINFHNNPNNPHEVAVAGKNPLTFDYMEYYDSGFHTIDTDTIDNQNWDKNGSLEPVKNGKATIQLIYFSMLYRRFIAFYGVEEFRNFLTAKERATQYLLEFEPPESIRDGLIPVGYIIVDENCNDLDDETTAVIVPWRQ